MGRINFTWNVVAYLEAQYVAYSESTVKIGRIFRAALYRSSLSIYTFYFSRVYNMSNCAPAFRSLVRDVVKAGFYFWSV